MLLFIASEVMFFAALFGVYFNVRATAAVWPPEGTEFVSWQGSGLFGLGLSVLITIILREQLVHDAVGAPTASARATGRA